MTAPRRCVVIPAIKKNAVIPDQLVKRLAGTTLMQRALDTALALAPGQDDVQSVHTAEIRNSAFCGNACAAEKYNVVRLFYHVQKFCCFFFSVLISQIGRASCRERVL